MHCPSMAKILAVLAFCGLLIAGTPQRAEAVSYNVGNSAGWDISADFPSWVSSKTLYVGDVLVFQYSRYHTLNEVDEAGYDNCTTTSALLTRSDGNTTVPLTSPGDRYFVCGNEMHCLGGMKLHVLVEAPPAPAVAPAGAPQTPPQTDPGVSPPGSGTDDEGLPTLLFGASHCLSVDPLVVTWLCLVTALLV